VARYSYRAICICSTETCNAIEVKIRATLQYGHGKIVALTHFEANTIMIMDSNVVDLDALTKDYALISSNFIYGVLIMQVLKYTTALYSL
jgi:hypothetical protein